MTDSLKVLIILILSLLLFASCESVIESEKADEINSPLIETSGTTAESSEKGDINKLEARLKVGAKAMRKVITDPRFREDLHQSLEFYSEQKNRFTAISFAELVSDDAGHRKRGSLKNQLTSQKTADMVRNALVDKNSPETGLGARGLNEFLIADLANLYVPNLDLWDGKEIPTITWHPLDEDESTNKGYQPVTDSRGKDKVVRWREVEVDEKYGEEHPVLIIMPGESFSYAPVDLEASTTAEGDVELFYAALPPPDDGGDGGGGGGGGGGDSSTDYYPPPCDEGTHCDETTRVYNGWVKLKHYPCGWFCSGRRIYFTHQEAYQNFYNSPLTIETTPSSVYVNKDDRGSWIRYYEIMDDDWPSYQLSKPLKVYIGRGGGINSVLEGLIKVAAAEEIGFRTVGSVLTGAAVS